MTLRIKSAPEILKAIRADAKRKGTHKLSLREINREIQAVRRERRRSRRVISNFLEQYQRLEK